MKKKWALVGIGALLVTVCVCIVMRFDRRWRADPARKLVNAAGLSSEELVKAIEEIPNINQRSSTMFGFTPLIAAVYRGNETNVALLLDLGADVNMADYDGKTPLMWAICVRPSNTNLLHTLINRGADPIQENKVGSDSFDLAKKQPNAVEISALLQTALSWQGSQHKNVVTGEDGVLK